MTNPVPMPAAPDAQSELRTSTPQMTSELLRQDAAASLRQLEAGLAHDTRQELRHIADPSQCGSIVQRHFTTLAFAVLTAVASALYLGTAGINLYLQMHP